MFRTLFTTLVTITAMASVSAIADDQIILENLSWATQWKDGRQAIAAKAVAIRPSMGGSSYYVPSRSSFVRVLIGGKATDIDCIALAATAMANGLKFIVNVEDVHYRYDRSKEIDDINVDFRHFKACGVTR